MPRILGMLPQNMGSYPRFLEIVPRSVNCPYCIDKNIYIQAEDGKFYNSKQVFYVLRENLEIPNILGQPFLSSCEVNLKYSKDTLRVPAVMKNKDKKDESIYLRIAKQKSISTLNHLEIQPGDTSATFYLKDVNIS